MLFAAPIELMRNAQCVATVESNRQAGNYGLAKGLNHGILYLLAAPYVAIAACAYLWYKKYRRKNIDMNIKSEKLHLN